MYEMICMEVSALSALNSPMGKILAIFTFVIIHEVQHLKLSIRKSLIFAVFGHLVERLPTSFALQLQCVSMGRRSSSSR